MVLPSRLSGRGDSVFLLILGGKPTGLRTVIFSSKAALFDRSCGVVGLFMGESSRIRLIGRNYRSAAAASQAWGCMHCCLSSGAFREIAPGGDGGRRAVAGDGRQLGDRMPADIAGGENTAHGRPHHDVRFDMT